MIIRASQLEKFNEIKYESFVIKTICFLKENFEVWAKGKTDDEIKKHILDMVVWAEEYDVNAGLNIQKLLHHKIAFGWEIPLHEKLEAILTAYKLDQHRRVNNFCSAVESKRYKLIEVNL